MGVGLGIAIAILAAVGATAQVPATPSNCSSSCNWGYAADNGPPTWGTLCCPVCDGSSQSPIDIQPGDTVQGNLEDLVVEYQESHLEFFNTGRTLEVAYELEDGENQLLVGERVYPLEGFHFHSLSEHTIEGRHAPLEMHLVHKRTSFDVAVLAVMIEEGPTRPAFLPLWNGLPADPTVEHRTVILDPGKLLPDVMSYYSYRGSLTTPGCAEIVTWYVLKEPIFMDGEQIEKFRALFASNYRPTQPLNGRLVSLHEE